MLGGTRKITNGHQETHAEITQKFHHSSHPEVNCQLLPFQASIGVGELGLWCSAVTLVDAACRTRRTLLHQQEHRLEQP